MYPSSATPVATLIANVRKELGQFDDATKYTDQRITDYLNEGQAWMLPDVNQKKVAAGTIAAGAASLTLPADYVRMISIHLDDGTPMPDFIELDGQLRFTAPDLSVIRAGTTTLFYEASFPKLGATCALPDPGNEGIVAFATWRILERVVVDRDDFRRFSTQTGSHLVTPQDVQEIADLYQQRYAAVRDLLAQRVAAGVTF
jgi:hypothetical protein